jgi:hypothetical protein
MNPETLLQGMAPSAIALQIGMALLILLAAVMTALDSRDRGARKEASVLWFFAIVIFPPVAIFYLMFRMRPIIRIRKTNSFPESQAEEKKCVYCGSGIKPGIRICPNCGRLL